MKRSSVMVCLFIIIICLIGAKIEKVRPDTTTTVVVERGDTLWGIAQEINPGQDPRRVIEKMKFSDGSKARAEYLQPGDRLIVPVWY